MKRILMVLFFIYPFLILFAQNKPEKIEKKKLERIIERRPKMNIKKIKEFSKKENLKRQKQKKTVDSVAKKLKIPKTLKDKNGNTLYLERIENGVPVYIELFNENSAKTISTYQLWENPYNLSGFGVDLGLWDEGKVYTEHEEFLSSNITWNDTASAEIKNHSTWLAGTIVANGQNQNAHGMAPDANLNTFNIDNDISEMAENSIFIDVSNNSYASACGWTYSKDTSGVINLYWMGDVSIDYNEDYKFGFYTKKSQSIDSLIYQNPYYLVVTAAGNNKGENPNGMDGHLHLDGKYYYDYHNNDGNNDGYDCLPGDFTTAKNTIVVGSIKDLPSGYISPYDVELDSSSGWGPTDDGRIKPDIVANGVDLITTGIASTSDYDTSSGTSFAGASVTGSIALINEFIDKNYFQDFLASTIKGLIIHTADDAGSEGPDYQYGWGVMNTKKVIDLIQKDIDDNIGSHIKEITFSNEPIEININCSGNEPLIVTMCWTDPAANSPSPSLDPSEKMLINDLDLTLRDENGTIHYPYILDPNSPSSLATTGDNDIDNVEKIYIISPIAGNYTAKITSENGQFFTQDFSLIVSGGVINSNNTPPPPPPNGYYRVTFDQRIKLQNEWNNSVDSLKFWDRWGKIIKKQKAPYYEDIKDGDEPDYNISATKKVLFHEKFNKWNNNSIKIQESFHVTGEKTILAKLDSVFNAKITTYFNSGNFGDSGIVYFKDPWYIDEDDSLYQNPPWEPINLGMSAPFKEKEAPFLLEVQSKRKGVFLEQGYDPVNNVWTQPYYEVKADAQQTFSAHGEDITGYFLGWEGTQVDFEHPDQLETAVVFKAENAEARAVYKGHLASNIARATGYNNGRRLYKASNGTIYMVYEDNGDIWFTSSTDGGKTWNKEKKLNSSSSNCINPAIDGHKDTDRIIFVWYEKEEKEIELTYYESATNTWSQNYSNTLFFTIGPNINPAPSVAETYFPSTTYGTKNNIYLAFNYEKLSETGEPTGISEVIVQKGKYDNDLNNWIWETILGPFEGHNPSISVYDKENEIGLVWDNDGKIFFKKLDSGGNWTATQQISDNLWYHQDNCKPNISYTNGMAHIVWEGYHAITEMPTGYYRYFKVDEERLSDLTILPSHGADVHHLSVSSKQYADNTTAYDYTVVYEGDGIIKVTQTSDNFEEENFGEGQYPNITEHDMSRSVWTKYNDAPYFLKTDYVESSGGGISPIIINPTPVIDYVISANQNNNVEGTITLEVEAVKFNHDTVYFDNALKSKTMSVTQDYVPLEMDLKVRFHNVYNGLNDEDVLYSLVFEDSTQGEIVLTNLKYKELPSPNGSDFEKFFKVTTIVNLAGKTGKICLKANGINPALITKRLDVYGQSPLSKPRKKTTVIPETFALSQNFPNPFNPVTHITVDLPQDAKVELSVFDINGKKVQTLLTGQKPAGIYEVIFDGKHLASGVYIYRLTTDKGFVQSRKMMLIK